MPQIDILNAQRAAVPRVFLSVISAYNEGARAGAGDLGTPLESVGGQRFLSAAVVEHWPVLMLLAETIAGRIERGFGAVVLQNLGFEGLPAELRDSLVLALTATLGSPTDHVGDRRVLWPVRDRPVDDDKVPTFSEALGEAPLHTDSAFADAPERYNALYCVVDAACGGGLTKLVSAPAVIDELAATTDGSRCLELLRTLEFPFRVPDAFVAGTRLVTAPVIGDAPLIRFRPDCIERGFAMRPDLDTPDHRWAFDLFRDTVERHRAPALYRLQRGEMIVFCNHRLLHARTDYRDPARHLIRVRMRHSGVSVAEQAWAA